MDYEAEWMLSSVPLPNYATVFAIAARKMLADILGVLAASESFNVLRKNVRQLISSGTELIVSDCRSIRAEPASTKRVWDLVI